MIFELVLLHMCEEILMKKRMIVNCFFIGAVLIIILWLGVQSIRDSKLESNYKQRFSEYDVRKFRYYL